MFTGSNTLHNAIFSLTDIAAIIGQFSDAKTTEVGLTNGFAEANAVGYWLIKKLGIKGLYILKCGVVPIICAGFYAAFGWNYGAALAAFFAGLGFALGIWNYKLIKQSNPNLKIF